jgi:hypothetical protein
VAKQLCVALSIVLGASSSLADIDKQSCVAAYDEGQHAKVRGELLRAREQLAMCARAECPGTISTECVQWLDEVNKAMPSIVIEVRGKDGADATNVRVLADGKIVTEHLDGRPIEMDPGEHDLLFEADGQDIPEQHVLVVEGQKARHVLAVAKVPPVAPPVLTRPMPVAGWIAGGVGVAALITFGVFASTGLSDYGHLPTCKCGAAESWDKTEFLVADIAIGAAVTALVVTAIIFLTRPTKALDHVALLPQLRF